MTTADRLAAAYAEVLQRSASRGAGRSATTVAGLPVISLGLPERWSNVVVALEGRPDPARVAEALTHFHKRDVAAEVLVRQADASALRGLRVVGKLPAYVAPAGTESRTGPVAGVEIEPVREAATFAAVYGAAFGMRAGMAEALVVPEDLEAPGTVHLVARDPDGGAAVGCALLRSAGGLGYVSAVGVLPDRRGRGIGTALLGASAAQAAADGCTGTWLHAAESSRGFYAGLGYELAETHVALA